MRVNSGQFYQSWRASAHRSPPTLPPPGSTRVTSAAQVPTLACITIIHTGVPLLFREMRLAYTMSQAEALMNDDPSYTVAHENARWHNYPGNQCASSSNPVRGTGRTEFGFVTTFVYQNYISRWHTVPMNENNTSTPHLDQMLFPSTFENPFSDGSKRDWFITGVHVVGWLA